MIGAGDEQPQFRIPPEHVAEVLETYDDPQFWFRLMHVLTTAIRLLPADELAEQLETCTGTGLSGLNLEKHPDGLMHVTWVGRPIVNIDPAIFADDKDAYLQDLAWLSVDGADAPVVTLTSSVSS